MLGKSHLFVGLTAGVVFDSLTHVSGHPLIGTASVTTSLLASKVVYYGSVGFGALLPDIDNAHSTMGRRFGWVSHEIQHVFGHRTLFHSFLGLALGSLLAIGAGLCVSHLFATRGIMLPSGTHNMTLLIFIGVFFGSLMHIAADAMTTAGVPLFWPSHKRYGFPGDPHLRFHTGTWPETVIVYSFLLLVAWAVWISVLIV